MAGPPSHSRGSSVVCAGLAGLAILACTVAAGQEVRFLLRNGDRLTGTILSEDAQRVMLTNTLLGRFTFPVGQIDRRIPLAGATTDPRTNKVLAAAPSAPAATNSVIGRRLDDLLAAYVSNRITPEEFHRERARLVSAADASARAGAVAVAGKAPPAVPARQPGKITGDLQAGLDLGFATKARQLYTGRMKVIHTQDHVRNTADYSFTYGRTDGEISANRMDGTLKTDYDLTRRIYLYNLGGGGYDEIRKLDNYFQIGPGAGDHLLKLTNFTLNVEGGANFLRQSFTDGTETDVFYYRLAQESKFWLNQKLTFDEKVEYFPQWNNFGEYKVRFEMNARYWLRGNLFLNFSMIDLYDTMPARGVEPNDLQIRSTIGVKF